MSDMFEDQVMAAVRTNPAVSALLPKIEAEVRSGQLLPSVAVEKIMAASGLR